jgi:F-type H+-transporting ATPase subunit b
MKRFSLLILTLCFAAILPAGFAQETSTGKGKSESSKEETFAERHELALKWANFALLAGLLGWVVRKNAGPFFAARSKKIRQEMIEAEEMRKEADARIAEVNRRLANLEAEIASLRAESQQEAHAETERSAQDTAKEIAKVQAQAEQEIVAAGKAARVELKRFTAQMALQLAEERIRGRLTPSVEDELVEGFVSDLNRPVSEVPIR